MSRGLAPRAPRRHGFVADVATRREVVRGFASLLESKSVAGSTPQRSLLRIAARRCGRAAHTMLRRPGWRLRRRDSGPAARRVERFRIRASTRSLSSTSCRMRLQSGDSDFDPCWRPALSVYGGLGAGRVPTQPRGPQRAAAWQPTQPSRHPTRGPGVARAPPQARERFGPRCPASSPVLLPLRPRVLSRRRLQSNGQRRDPSRESAHRLGIPAAAPIIAAWFVKLTCPVVGSGRSAPALGTSP